MNKSYAFYLPILFTLLALILNYFYWKSLYELGVRFILFMQAHSTPALDNFFIFFTLIVDPVIIVGLIVLGFALLKKKL